MMTCRTCGAAIEPGAHHCPTQGCPRGPKPIKVDVADWQPYEPGKDDAGKNDAGEQQDSRWWTR